jgi:hypothetical protein
MKYAARMLLGLLFVAVPLIAQETPAGQGQPEAPPKHKVIVYFPQWGLYGGYPFAGYFVKI